LCEVPWQFTRPP